MSYITPFATRYMTPFATRYMTPFATRYTTPFATRYLTPFATRYITPFGTRYITPFATRYITPFATHYTVKHRLQHFIFHHLQCAPLQQNQQRILPAASRSSLKPLKPAAAQALWTKLPFPNPANPTLGQSREIRRSAAGRRTPWHHRRSARLVRVPPAALDWTECWWSPPGRPASKVFTHKMYDTRSWWKK